ncbi:glycosyltransferase family 4 protein [Enterococcus casseliflavus]|nr:glycosyltransferase family 4 protein [Enterococcus casseliflavus]
MKKILHICTNYVYSDLYYELVSRLEKNCYNTVYSPINNSYDYIKNSNENFEIVIRKAFDTKDRFYFKRKSKKIFQTLTSSIDVKNYEIIHAHTLFTDGNVAYTLWKKFKIPYVITVRSTDTNFFIKYYKHLKKLGNQILSNASRIIFLSPSSRKKIMEKLVYKDKIEYISQKSILIPNGINSIFFNNDITTNKGINLSNEKVKILTVGRIEKNKNQLFVCSALKDLVNRGYSIQYDLVGNFSSERYKKKVMKFDFVNYLGLKNKKELLEIYSNADIFILVSKSETFGLTYAESISQNTPIIYTKFEGFDGQFDEGEVGYHVKYNSKNELKKLIVKILQSKENFADISNYSKKFDWEIISLRIFKIYENIIKETGVEW